jgi:hypothetical protein
MKRVLLVLSLCLVGGLASTAGAGECSRGRCREACPAVADDGCHGNESCRGEYRRGPVRRLLRARPVRKLFENRPVRRFLFGRCCR